MKREHCWLTEAQFERFTPLLPTDTQGKPRVDDRRVISGIIHVPKSGCRWKDAPDAYGPHKTLYNRFVRWAARGHMGGCRPRPCLRRRTAGSALDRLVGGQGAPLCVWRQRVEKSQAIGRSRGGRTTKIHALTDAQCRPVAFMLTGGQVADCTAAEALLEEMPNCRVVPRSWTLASHR